MNILPGHQGVEREENFKEKGLMDAPWSPGARNEVEFWLSIRFPKSACGDWGAGTPPILAVWIMESSPADNGEVMEELANKVCQLLGWCEKTFPLGYNCLPPLPAQVFLLIGNSSLAKVWVAIRRRAGWRLGTKGTLCTTPCFPA